MSKAKNDYYDAVKVARTACGSCRSLQCEYCQKIVKTWRVYLEELLKTKK